MQQKAADADSFAAQQQQVQQQTQQQTLALLDQSHLQQLSRLHSQLQEQSLTHQASEAKLKQRVGQQDESVQQLQEQVRQLEQQCKELKQSCATERAVAKSLLKASASKEGAASDSSNDRQHDASSDSMCDDSSNDRQQDASSDSMCDASITADATAAADHSNSLASAGHVASSVAAMAYTTLSLETDVLRKEARILKEQLSKTEAANQVLVQTQKQDKQQHMAQLSTLRQTMDELDEKHQAAAAMLDDTVAAMTHRTSLILQQRQTGMQPFSSWAACFNNYDCLPHTEAQQLHCMNGVAYHRHTY